MAVCEHHFANQAIYPALKTTDWLITKLLDGPQVARQIEMYRSNKILTCQKDIQAVSE